MQVEHKTEKGTLLFFLPPKLADRFKIFKDIGRPYLSYFVEAETYREYIEDGFELIGLTSEVSEDQAKMIMPRALEKQTDFGINYGYMFSPMDTNIYISGQDAFKALMQHLKVYEVNPFECADDIMTHKNLTLIEYGKADIKHENAETRTGKWVILFKKSCI